MVDIEDIVEAVVEIEDIVEEIAEPDELVEDFLETPLMIAFALAAGVAAVLTLLLVAVTLLFALFALGPVAVAASLVVVSGLVTLLTVAGFVYFRTEIPADLRRTIEAARARSDGTRREDASMSEAEAIDELKTRYARGRLTEAELERALEDVLTSADPERVLERAV
jgi:hypothetical protein